MSRKPDFKVEDDLERRGFLNVCGIDEAGRGAWAGPLLGAAVILDTKKTIDGIDDSKRLSSKQREKLSEIIKEEAVAYGIGLATVQEINKFGIQSATYLSFQRAIDKLAVKPDFALIDHYRLPSSPIPQKAISFGDQTCLSIAAASIIAKVERDKIMVALSSGACLRYGFEQNYGYGTDKHQKMIVRNGLCDNHRIKFVSGLFAKHSQEQLFDEQTKRSRKG